MISKRLTRKELLMVIGHCQNLFGHIQGVNHDRNTNRAAQVQGACEAGFDFCLEALSLEPPVESSGKSKWAKGPKYGNEI